MKQKICKAVSIISVAPLVALYMLTIIYFHDKSIFGSGSLWYVLSLFFLTIMPISAYVLKYVIPPIRKQGRHGERKLAFIMCVAGYIFGTAVSFIFNAPTGVKVIFLGYLLSGGLLAIINSVVKVKASGHACGVSGPYVMLLFFLGIKVWYIIFLLIPIFWARLNMGRHTYKELLYGTIIGMAGTAIAVLTYAHI